jgi:threonine/homoserine/homoserine lactone efflux protein
MDLLLLGAGTGIAGGLVPSPLHLIALTQVALNRWGRAILILAGLPLVIDGALLLVSFFFYQYIPHSIAHAVSYVGGIFLLAFGCFSLAEMRRKAPEEMARSAVFTSASVTVAALAELATPGTWIYWLTVAGPIIAEGRRTGYGGVVPFFAGGLLGYYGAALLCVWLMAWGATLYKRLARHLLLIANLLLVALGISYLARARFGG